MLDREMIVRLLEKINNKLRSANKKGEIIMVGGALMCVYYQSRATTKDVDAIFFPSGDLREIISEVGDEEGIESDWLNDGVKGFLTNNFDKKELLFFSNLKVWQPETEYILAMKCLSSRVDSFDQEDIQFLIKYLGISNVQQVFDIISKYYSKDKILPKTQFFLEEIFEDIG